jgi:hypothetical protein
MAGHLSCKAPAFKIRKGEISNLNSIICRRAFEPTTADYHPILLSEVASPGQRKALQVVKLPEEIASIAGQLRKWVQAFRGYPIFIYHDEFHTSLRYEAIPHLLFKADTSVGPVPESRILGLVHTSEEVDEPLSKA